MAIMNKHIKPILSCAEDRTLYPSIKLLSSLFLSTCLITLLFALINPVTAAEEEPTLAFSTYLGGDGNEFGEDIAVDRDGNIYVTGSTSSTNFPATDPLGVGSTGMYLTKFDSSGTTQLYSIFLGLGTPYGIAVDADGAAYVVGKASSIPTVSPIQATNSGGEDAFITKINPAGTALVYSTYLGGSSFDTAFDVALNSFKNAYIVGITSSTNFPTSNPFQPANAGGSSDIFVTRLNAAGTALVYSTYYGGSGRDISMGIAVDNSGNAFITGDTGSNNFPTLNAYQPNHANWCAHPPGNPCTDVYVAKFSLSGIPLYSTYLGGDGIGERGNAIAVDTLGSAYITGLTDSSDFPITSNAYQTMLPPINRATFVTKLSPNGTSLMYSTYLGGTTDGADGLSIAVGLQGEIFVGGATWATDFPVARPIQAEKDNGNPVNTGSLSDAFVTQFSPDGTTLLFSTYFGGGDQEYVEFSPHMAVDRNGSVYLTGSTFSNDFPLKNAFQDEPGGSSTPLQNFDAFIVKIDFPLISFPNAAAERNYFTTHTPTLTWNTVTWALGYRVQMDKSQSFTDPYDFEGDALASADSITTDDLDNGFYYWRILAQKPDGSWDSISPVDSFTIDVDD
jgi:hypothetical protein